MSKRTTLWMARYDLDGASGWSLFSTKAAAKGQQIDWEEDGEQGRITVTKVRLCDENDPDMLDYDYERASYFAKVN
jgi:hypothetical protein